jgi:flagellar motor protein MotB
MKTIKILSVLFLFLIVSAPSVLATEYTKTILNSSLHKTEELYERVKDYKNRIAVINEQIKGIMDEMDRLYLNMERIKDSERTVPHKFFVSIKEKKYNIKRLKKERGRYYALVESYLAEINSRVLKDEKHSMLRSNTHDKEIQEEVIHEDPVVKKAGPVAKAISPEIKQPDSNLKEDERFEKLANETKRLEGLLDRYAELIDQGSEASDKLSKQKVSEQPDKIKTATIIEKKSSGQDIQQILNNQSQKEIVLSNNAKASIDKKKLYYEIHQAGLADWIEMSDNGECLRLKTTLPILFPIGSAEIAKEYNSFFTRFANLLKAYEVQILVEGYADIDPIHNKKYPSNFELGAIRAANVVHELVKNGLKPSIFKINSPGKYRFTANGEPTQKALERRAEVTVVFVS